MEIKEITVTAEASKAYQKYCVALTATDLKQGDMEKLKNIVISHALKGIDEMVNVPEEPVVRVAVSEPQVEQQPQQPYHEPVKKFEFKEKLTGQVLSTGAIWKFCNDKNNAYADYKLCYSKEKNEYFWALLNLELINNGFKKYLKSGIAE